MSNRGYNRDWNNEQDPRRREGRDPFPSYDDYGLHSQDRQQYRGRESYEQQSRGGPGGRSGAFDHRNENENSYRDRLGPGREGRSPEPSQWLRGRDDDDDRRYGFDSRDFTPGYNGPARDFGRGREAWRAEWQPNRGEDDHSRGDWGTRSPASYGGSYTQRLGSPYDDYEPRIPYSQRSSRDFRGSPYGEQPSSAYDRPYRQPGARDDYRAANQNRWDAQGGQEYGQRYTSGGYTPSASEQGSEPGRYGSGDYAQSVLRRQGKGPKGYKRSDERIREDVCDRLSHQWDLDASEIEVTVTNGEVTLAGTIDDRSQKHRAENVADAVSGVNEVHNQLRIKRDLHVQGEREPSQTAMGSGTGKSSSQSTRHS